MKTSLVNLGIPAGFGAKAPSCDPHGTSGSFALELSALWSGSPGLDTDSEASSPSNAKDQQPVTGKNNPPAASSGFASTFPMQGEVPLPNSSGNAAHKALPDAADISASPGSRARVASPSALQNESLPASKLETASPSPQAQPDASAFEVAPFSSVALAEPAEKTGQPQLQSSPGPAASAPANRKAQLNVTGGAQPQMATRQNRDISFEVRPEMIVQAAAVPPAVSAEPAEPNSPFRSQSAPGLVASTPTNAPAQLNLTGGAQPPSSYRQPTDNDSASCAEPQNPDLGSAQSAASSSAAQEVSPYPVLSPLPGAASFEDPDALSTPGILATGADSSVSQPDPDKPGKPGYGAGLHKDASSSLQQGSGAQATPRSTGLPRETTLPQISRPDTELFRVPSSDGGGDLDHAAGRSGSQDGTPGAVNIAPAGVDCTQAGGGSPAAAEQIFQGAQEDSAADGSPVPVKTGSFATAAQKANSQDPAANPQLTVDPLQLTRRSSDAQSGSAPSSTDSTGHANPTLQNWDAARETAAQQVSSAHLAELMGRSELQVDMKSDSWGPVSVRAILSNGQVGAEIQVSDRDAHATLTEGLQALEKTLGDKGIQVASLDISRGLEYNQAQSQSQQDSQARQPQRDVRAHAFRSALQTEIPAASTVANSAEDFVLSRVSVRV